jgi:hypothetical protein
MTRAAQVLARWYDINVDVQRAEAYELAAVMGGPPVPLVVVIAAAPTMDGSDALPVWISQASRWQHDLEENLDLPVRLLPHWLVGTQADHPATRPGAKCIARIAWREEAGES